MIISYQWLLEYLPEPVPVKELCDILTSIGLEVEAAEPVETVKGSLEGLVLAKVVTCEKHPNADKLSLTTVTTDGTNSIQVVCGAPNVAAGQKIVFAPVGATVHPTAGDAFTIGKAKIRGCVSEGMICAEDEIGLGSSHAGIMILPEDAPLGMPAKTWFKIPEADFAIHIGLTPNRSDANSHIGVARDVCAYLTHHKGKKYHVSVPASLLPVDLPVSAIKVHIESEHACPRYCGIGISGIKVGESPEWLKSRLKTIGVRSINNIVDATNYVLHEYGQPLHAFDQEKISGNNIIVKYGEAGCIFTGLDEKERQLRANDLMICDASGPLAIGGIFGGNSSGITDVTTQVFLESAYFDPTHIRRSSMYHGLRTDAATHFEKGVDINNVIPALERAALLIADLGGGKISSLVTDNYPVEIRPKTVSVDYQFINKLSGKAYKPEAVKSILQSLGFVISSESDSTLELIVPTNKMDVSQPADIVEEVLRIDGLDNIMPTGRMDFGFSNAITGDLKEKERIAQLLCGMGFQELVTNSITNSRYFEGNQHLVHMINSLSNDLDVMRPSMTESGLDVIGYNCNRKNNDLKLFEFGNIYSHSDSKYSQESVLAIWCTGRITTSNWAQPSTDSNIYYTRGIVDNLLNYIGITGVVLTFTESNEIVWKHKNKVLARTFAVSKEKLKDHDVKQDVYYAEINWDAATVILNKSKTAYREIPKFPIVQRDIALILDDKITYKMVEDATDELKISSLLNYKLFDKFEGEKLGKGKKSYAISYSFQAADHTLTDEETELMVNNLMDSYRTKLHAQINS